MMKWQRGGLAGGRGRWLLPLLVILGLLIAGFLLFRSMNSWFAPPEPQTIAQASLQSMREQNRLITFSAQYVAVVTSTQDRLGGLLKAKKTMIMPGEVRYELDLSKLDQEDLRWNAGSNTLSVTLPPIEVSQPQVDPNAIREFSDGNLVMSVTNAEDALDRANRQAGVKSLMEQARRGVQMRLARENAKRTIARNFALPLRAAGVEANVEVRFADEARQEPSYLDRSTPMNEVLGRPVNVKQP